MQDQFGNQEIEIRIALPVRMGRHIDRDAGNVSREVRPVIEIEATQEILVRLAVTRVLGNDQPGHHLEHFARPLQRNGRQTLAGNDPLTAGDSQTFKVFRLGTNLDGGQLEYILSRDTPLPQAGANRSISFHVACGKFLPIGPLPDDGSAGPPQGN